MGWVIKYHRNAKKFLENLDERIRSNIQKRLEELETSLEEGVIPFRTQDIRRLKGKWKGFLRMRIGDIRIIFRVDYSSRVIWIYNIHYRGKIY